MEKDNKLGLALSGGGFRASFFHIGFLARLAELDMLRRVEALSTVSGGSIIGALYYLHVKKLLESKKDADITKEDYIRIVSDISENFLAGVQRNIRMRTFGNFFSNLRMYSRNYSRSNRLGELYEKYFYAPVLGKDNITMPDLMITPHGYDTFHPYKQNHELRCKVPILLINATTLNTGNNWQFTASYMGESPSETQADKNARLRRMYYGRFLSTGIFCCETRSPPRPACPGSSIPCR